MATHLSEFRSIIFKVLQDEKSSVSIEKLYDAAIIDLSFDEHDLEYTTIKSSNTKEPNWKRNLRNALQGLKKSGKLVNSSPGQWRLPSVDKQSILEPQLAWELIKIAAHKALKDKSTWESVKQGRLYWIEEIQENKILIRRDFKDTVEQLYKSDVLRGITSLNAAGGSLGRRSMNYTVAKEVAMVYLHPNLEWDETFETLKVHSIKVNPLEALAEKFEEAEDDDVNAFQSYARRIRKGQSKLRKNLLAAYQNKCCISSTGPENVLQAAHIDSHAESGSNTSTNGLLLRSDLHDLFDDGLLLIDPQTMTVKIHPSLADTYYYQYNEVRLQHRIDNLRPDKECLKRRWVKYYWFL